MPNAAARLLVVLGLMTVAGCKDAPKQPTSKPVVAGGNAVVSGVVKFDGTSPGQKVLGDFLCGQTKKPIPDESLIVNAEGLMQNVVVYLEDGPNVQRPSEPAVLDQHHCQYVPHVIALRTGETLTVKSSDPTLHNAHSDKGENRSFNLSFVDAGQTKQAVFSEPEVGIRVRCDVHQWMNAFVAVFDHPFFTVTGEGGSFELKGIPAGTYTLVAWHERYGQKKQPVTVGADGLVKDVVFAFGK